MKQQTVWVITFVVVILVIVAALYSNNKRQVPVLTSDTVAITNSSTTGDQAVPITSAQNTANKCGADAKAYFDTWDSTPSNDTKTVALTYQNYYDSSNNSCYVLVNYNFDMKYYAHGSTPLHITYALVDVSKKDPTGNSYTKLGSYSSPANYSRVDECNVSGQQCNSLESFLTLVNPYLGK
jgi:hypothetical protein